MLNQSKFALATLGLSMAMMAQADSTIVFSDTGGGQSKAAGQVEISNGLVRSSSPGDSSAYMIFDSGADHFTMIDVDRKTYMVFDQAQIEELAGMQKRAMQQMEAQLANLPAAQREQMRKMMSNMMGGAEPGKAPEPHRYERSGKTDEVAGYTCEVLKIYIGERMAGEQCVVSQDELGIPAEDYRTMKAMQQFIVELVSQFPMVGEQVMEYGEPGRDEIPVRYSHQSKMTGTTVGELQSISFDDIDASRFEIPEGFKKQEMPKM
jgi:hypothetical protein